MLRRTIPKEARGEIRGKKRPLRRKVMNPARLNAATAHAKVGRTLCEKNEPDY